MCISCDNMIYIYCSLHCVLNTYFKRERLQNRSNKIIIHRSSISIYARMKSVTSGFILGPSHRLKKMFKFSNKFVRVYFASLTKNQIICIQIEFRHFASLIYLKRKNIRRSVFFSFSSPLKKQKC